MEKPLLGSRKKLALLRIPQESAAPPMQPPLPSPSSIKERLIFGPPTDYLQQAAIDCPRYTPDPVSELLTAAYDGEDERRTQDEHSYQAVFLLNDDDDFYEGDDDSIGLLPKMDSPKSSTPHCNEEEQLYDHAAGLPAAAWVMDHATKHLFRSRTAPAVFGSNRTPAERVDFGVEAPPSLRSPMSVVSQAFIGLMVYLAVGMLIYTLRGHEFSGATTNGFFDALYFCIVTMCTIGYGDITPVTPLAKLFSCAFVLVGFGFIDILLSAMVSYVLQRQETLLLNSVAAGPHETAKNYLVDIKKGRMRIRSKVVLAFGVVILCIGVGTLMMHSLESLGWLDSFYLSCMSVTTVGYGDHAFKTLSGRVFASVWLLVSTLAVAQSFLYLAEARIDKRHRLIAKWVLEKEMTLGDLLAADLDNDGNVSKSDFVVYKLKEMGKIDEKDIMEICRQFSRLDPDDSGKITLSCLINLHKASAIRK